MDKKTIIGIVLIALILLLTPIYQKWVVGTIQPENQQKSVDTLSVNKTNISSAGDTISSHILTSPDTSALVPDTSKTDTTGKKIVPHKIFVHTDKYDMVLSTLGGDIISEKLKGITDGRGKPVDIFPRPLNGPNCELVLVEGNKTISTASVNFTADKDSIRLDDNNPKDAITMVGILPDGSMIQRRYEFENGKYHIIHKIFVVGKDSTTIFTDGILWLKSGLLPTETNFGWDIREFATHYKIVDDIDKIKPSKKKPSAAIDGATDWAGLTSKYFATVMMPRKPLGANGIRTNTYWYRDSIAQKDIPIVQYGLYYRIGDNKFTKSQTIYAGPRDWFTLKKYGRKLGKIVGLGWWWLAPITQFLLILFKYFYKVIPNYGWVIIIFTILMKLVLTPIAHNQLKSMKRMKKIQPELRSLQEKYRDDPQKLNVEMMKLYKKRGVSPLSGCLPLLVQMPVFFALYRALASGFQFRAQPFIFWIKDLSQKDPYFVLPILMGITMFIQQKISVTDPKQKTMAYIMPIVFLFFFYNLPAGLVLYWTVFNILSVIHMLWVEHKWVDKNEISAETESTD